MGYDPNQGRFIERDPIGYANGLNTYEALMDNPIAFNDPFGTQVLDSKEEGDLWAKQKAAADAALAFWAAFLTCRKGKDQ